VLVTLTGCGRCLLVLETTLKNLFRCMRTSVYMGCGRKAGGLGTSALGRLDLFAELSANGRYLRRVDGRSRRIVLKNSNSQWRGLAIF
jgi:hypothetical protein